MSEYVDMSVKCIKEHARCQKNAGLQTNRPRMHTPTVISLTNDKTANKKNRKASCLSMREGQIRSLQSHATGNMPSCPGVRS